MLKININKISTNKCKTHINKYIIIYLNYFYCNSVLIIKNN